MSFMCLDKLREVLNNSGLTDKELQTYIIDVVDIPHERILNPNNIEHQKVEERKCDAWYAWLDKEHHRLVVHCYYPGSMVCYTGYDEVPRIEKMDN